MKVPPQKRLRTEGDESPQDIHLYKTSDDRHQQNFYSVKSECGRALHFWTHCTCDGNFDPALEEQNTTKRKNNPCTAQVSGQPGSQLKTCKWHTKSDRGNIHGDCYWRLTGIAACNGANQNISDESISVCKSSSTSLRVGICSPVIIWS